MTAIYRHPIIDHNGKILSMANIIWAERDRGSDYYRVSRFAMRAGKFPPTHPCAPFDDVEPDCSQNGGSKSLTKFRARGYWASCFPEGDGITLKWWGAAGEPCDKTADEVMHDIWECFGWDIHTPACARKCKCQRRRKDHDT